VHLKGSWKLSYPPVPASSDSSALYAVSCPNANFCLAAGWSEDNLGNDHLLVDRWNGTSWSLNQTGAATSAVDNDVSFIGTTFCLLLGFPTADWNGSDWTVVSAEYALGLSCTSPTVCVDSNGMSGTVLNGSPPVRSPRRQTSSAGTPSNASPSVKRRSLSGQKDPTLLNDLANAADG
jgi:hypothetical protein